MCLSKHNHDSRAEAEYCNSLLADKQAGRILGFSVQVSYDVGPAIKHIVDFVVMKQDPLGFVGIAGRLPVYYEAHDVKGFQTAVWKMKYKLFVDRYPKIKYVIINRKEGNGREISQRRRGAK